MAKPEHQHQQPTDYVVVQKDGPDAWKEVNRVKARSRNEAVRTGTREGENQLTGTFKAIPARSWDWTVGIRTRTETVALFEESKNGAGQAAPEPTAE